MDRNAPILLVEDHPDDEYLTLHALRKHGLCNVLVARDAEAAIRLLLDKGEAGTDGDPPQFILLDLKMPKMDGFELLETIRRHDRSRSVPVVVLSSSEQPKDKERCCALQVSAFINKPLDSTKLALILQTVEEEKMINKKPFSLQ